MTTPRPQQVYLISIVLFFAAGAWGFYWLPQRALEDAGMTGGWGTIAQYGISVVILAPLAIWRWSKGLSTGLGYPWAGLLLGGGIVCYANSFLLTDVVRALLLFYLTPLWATVIEAFILKRRPGWQRAISLGVSGLGVWVVIGQGISLPWPQNLGDWLALVGGVMFAGAAARIERDQPEGVFPIVFAFFIYGGAFAFLQAPFLTASLGPMPELSTWIALTPWFLVLSLGFFIPTNMVISTAPKILGVGLFSILILSELVFGAISAALWADEPFGWREALGCSLILLAGIIEVALAPRRST